jgi:hypothetical protein
MNGSLETAIASLVRRLQEKERMANELHGAANELRETINLLCIQAGLPPRYPGGDSGGGAEPPSAQDDAIGGGTGTGTMQINGDTFFGQKQASAIRSYLEIRRRAGTGPARPREIYDALRQGGYQFKAKDDETALVGMRTLLRKANTTFLKVPGTSGAYGLRAWYPHVQAARATTGPGIKTEPKSGDDVPEVSADGATVPAGEGEEVAA